MILKSSSRLYRGIAAVILLLGAGPLDAHEPPAGKPPKKAAAKAPDFALIDQDNRRFDSAQLRGKVVVANFIFTTCTDVCPLFTVNLVELQRRLAPRFANEVFFLSITTDPEIDSPQVLKAYAERHRADLKNWAFLTGPESDLQRVWKSFNVRVIRKGRGLVQHTSLTTVIDRQGIRRFNHWGEQWRLQDLEKDVLALLEKKN